MGTQYACWVILCTSIFNWQTNVGDPWLVGADPDPIPYLWLMDPGPDPDPTQDPTSFLVTLRMQKNIFPRILQAHYLQPYFLLKFCVKILFCKHYFRKGKDPEPDLDPDPGGPKTCGPGSGSPTLWQTTYTDDVLTYIHLYAKICLWEKLSIHLWQEEICKLV